MRVSGRSIIGFQAGSRTGEVFHAINPALGEQIEPDFFSATSEEVDRAANLAHEAFPIYRRVSGRNKAAFLCKIAANIESVIDELVDRAEQETALPKARLQGETARTCSQLRL